MKKEEVKTLKNKLAQAINLVLTDNQYYITKKAEKSVKKSVKRIVQKAGKQIQQHTTQI